MEEYIKTYGKGAGIYESSSLLGGSVVHPAYMIVFLIHVLAHDTDFPTVECRDEEMYIRFFRLVADLAVVLWTYL